MSRHRGRYGKKKPFRSKITSSVYREAKKFKKFLEESLAVAIEKERVFEVRTILTLDIQSKANFEQVLEILERFVRQKSPLTKKSRSLLVFIKKVEWKNFLIGRKDENKNTNHRKICDNMLHYACRYGKTCFIDILLDEGTLSFDQKCVWYTHPPSPFYYSNISLIK